MSSEQPCPETVPIAIVGVGMRLPGGVSSPDDLVDFLTKKGDGVCDVPADRWNKDLHYYEDPSAPGKVYVKAGGFLEGDVFAFDPLPFGISPREAEVMDPQQRLLLEVTWEALENAGVPTDAARGSNTGVFIGGFMLDHHTVHSHPENQKMATAQSAAGCTATSLSSRISYTFDLRGPCMTVDTACSSSLVAVDLACKAIANGSCEAAIAGGVNVMLSPSSTLLMCKGGFLSPDGRCKAFDGSADGYGRGEGAAVVYLKRLDRAVEDGDRIFATVLASGVNQDGKTDGMATPSATAQIALAKNVLSRAGIDSSHVGYVEAHGTGTRVGDPLEAAAIGAVYGGAEGRQGPVLIGSIKTNISHLEAAAGIVGFIKAALILHTGVIFPQRSFTSLNRAIPFGEHNVEVCVNATPLPSDAPFVAVNSFGYGGTNAHAILAKFDAGARAAQGGEETTQLLPLCAMSQASLSSMSTLLADFLERNPETPLREIGQTLARGRSHFPERLVVAASDRAGAITALRDHAKGATHAALAKGSATAGKSLFVYNGMGPQWWRMGRELLESEPVFRAAAETIDAYFVAVARWSILAEIVKDEDASRISESWVAQPANFVIQAALTELLRHRGLRPDGYLGHSVGEISAAWAAGCLTLEEATHAVYHRSHVMRGLKGGAMLAVAVSAARAESMVLPGSNVSIASYNAPNSVVLSGDRAALEPIASRLKAEGVFARFLEVQLAYHSSAVDPMETAALESLAFLAPKTPTSVIFSTMTGSRVDRAVHDAEYWWRNIRSSVKFHQAVEAAVEQGFSTFIEVGPHPVLGPSIQEILTSMKEPGRTLFSLKRHTPEQHSINSVVSQAFCCGTKLDWGGSRSFVDLPHYPFQRQRLWKESAASSDARVGPYAHGHPGRTSSGHPGRTSSSISSGSLGGHPLLGVRESSPGHSWLTSLPNMPLAFFRDHQIQGVVVFPAAGYIEAALAAAAAARVSVYHGSSKNLNDLQDASGQVLALKNLEFQSVLAIQQKQATRIRVRLTEDSTFSLHGQAGDAPWTQYAVGRVLAMATFRTPPSLDLAEAFEELERNAVPGDDLYQALAARWMEYGPQFQAVKRLARHAGGVVAELELHASAPGGFLVHPSLVDGAFQSLTYLVSESQAHLVGTLVPVRIASVRLFRALESRVMVVCNGGLCKDGTLQGDVTVTDASGAVLLTMKGVVLSPVGGNADEGATSQLEYAFEWEELEWEDTPEPEMPEADSSAFKFRVLEGVETLPWLSAHHSDEATHLVWVAPASDSDTFGLDATERLLEILRGPLDECRLTVLTRGAHAISRGETCNPAHTGLWSFVRVLMTERPELSVRLIDLPREVDGLDVEMTSAAIFAADNQEETAVRASSQFARKLVRADKGDSDRQLERETVRAQSGPYEVFVPRPGILDSLCFRPRVLGDPGPLDVEVEVHCCSLNFKDVMKALGMLNATVLNNTYLGNGIGMEASGRVLRVGAQVADLKMGDDVHCHVGGAMATRLTMDHRWVVKKASCSSFAEASCYFVYTTAWHSLVNVARLQRGERVLIHSAAGGVGQAAIQVAQMIGAEVYATAGTAEKRKELSDAGILHVYDSRTLDFADDIRRDTKGEGVNVVLNSLAGEALHESFELLCTGGRFVELGKKDIAGSAALNMLPFNKSITFSAVDLDRIGLDSAVYRPLALSVVAAVEAGDLVPMKMHHFAGDRVVDAFRLMASGSMTGKAVVHLSEGTLEVAPGFASNKVFRADRSYLVTGGLGGFGLQTAAFLVGQGARHLVLVSRRGAPADADRHVIDGMQGLGASVHVRAVDVSDRDAVARLLDEIRRDLPPLAGVFHAAAILDDGPIADITPQNLARVVAPKAIGAWILHELTQDTPLDHFVLFSSITSAVGNSFQGAYCLANGFINGLAAVRRAMGLPAKAVLWGAIDDVGMLERDQPIKAHLCSIGVNPLPSRRCLQILFSTPGHESYEVLGITDMDWGKWVRAHPGTTWTLLSKVLESDCVKRTASSELAAALGGLDESQRHAHVVGRLLVAVGRVFGIAPGDLDASRSLKEYGLDSLIAVEMRVVLEEEGLVVTTMELLSGRSIEEIADQNLAGMVISSLRRRTSVSSMEGSVERTYVERTPEVPSTPQALRAQFLERICVQPPYFALDDFSNGAKLSARAPVQTWADHEGGPISASEAARHLAILGSCAVSLKNPMVGRVYYPIKTASMRIDTTLPRITAASVLMTATCTLLDLRENEARATATMFGEHGEEVAWLEVSYHMIAERDMSNIFKDHKVEENGPFIPGSPDPYLAWPSSPEGKGSSQLRVELGPVEQCACAGHFDGFPAFPVSVMQRHVTNVLAKAVRTTHNWRAARVTVVVGAVTTHRFAWAGQHVVLKAKRESLLATNGGQEAWRCDVSAENGAVATFTMTLVVENTGVW